MLSSWCNISQIQFMNEPCVNFVLQWVDSGVQCDYGNAARSKVIGLQKPTASCIVSLRSIARIYFTQ